MSIIKTIKTGSDALRDFDDDLLADAGMGSNNPVKLLRDISTSAYREDLVRTLVAFREKLEGRPLTPQQLKIKYKVLRALDLAHKNENLPKVEKLIRSTTSFFAEPTHLIQLRISIVIILYTVLTVIGFTMLTLSESIMLPSFNIPYSVLLMGMIGCLVSMYVKLPRVKNQDPLPSDSAVWFIISPPISIIMAGLFFGVFQILLNLTNADLTNEYWYYWILAWIVGFINWVSVYEKTNFGAAAFKPGAAPKNTPMDEIVPAVGDASESKLDETGEEEDNIKEEFKEGLNLLEEDPLEDDALENTGKDTKEGIGG